MLDNAYEDMGYRVPKKEKLPTVPWAFMTYEKIVEAGMIDLVRAHLAELKRDYGDEAARNYKFYLRDWCQFPREFFA